MNSSYHASAAGLIKRLGWPTISDIILGETATIMFKSTNGLVPEYLSELFVKNSALNTQKRREGGQGEAVAPPMFSRTTFLILLIPA